MSRVIGLIKSIDLQKQPFIDVFQRGVLKNFAILIRKHLCWSLFLIRLQAFRPATLLKRDTLKQMFFCNFLRAAFLIEHLWWLLLDLDC